MAPDESLNAERDDEPPRPPFKPAWLVEADKLHKTVTVEHPSYGGRAESRRRKKANNALGSTRKSLSQRRLVKHWLPALREEQAKAAAAIAGNKHEGVIVDEVK